MRRTILAALLAASASAAFAAPTPKEQLLVPPADADAFRGRVRSRQAWRRISMDAARRQHRLPRVDPAARPGVRAGRGGDARRDGRPTSITIRGVTPSGDAAETFAIDQATARWKTTGREGEAPASKRRSTYTFGGTFLAGDATDSAVRQGRCRRASICCRRVTARSNRRAHADRRRAQGPEDGQPLFPQGHRPVAGTGVAVRRRAAVRLRRRAGAAARRL